MKKLEWLTVQRKVNDLLPLDINPRKISEAKKQQLIKSIEKFNLAEIPAVNKDNTIISGHQRIKALQLIDRGEEMIDVRVPNRQLTRKEMKEYNLISNTHAGEWDFEILEVEFEDVKIEEIWDFDIPGFDMPTTNESSDNEKEKVQKPIVDLSDKVDRVFEVVIECTSEREQEHLFNKLKKEGYLCRVLTL